MIFYLGERRLDLNLAGEGVQAYFNLGEQESIIYFYLGEGVLKRFQPVTPYFFSSEIALITFKTNTSVLL